MKRFFLKVIAAFFDILILPVFLLIYTCCLLPIRFGKRKDSLKLFFGTMHINNWTYVAKAIQNKGYKSTFVVWDPPLHEIGVISYDLVFSVKHKRLFKNLFTRYLLSYYLFFWALLKYDIFIMCFKSRLLDRTVLLSYLELPLLKLARKVIILNTYGADVMTPRLTLPQKCLNYSILKGYLDDPYYNKINEKEIEKNRKYCERWADCIISAIDHVEYLERVDEYFHMRCVDLKEITPCYETKNNAVLIIHAPNHRLLKGTDYLIKAVKKLQEGGLNIELKIFEKMSHKEIQQWIAKSDIVADQFLLGAYARFAIEAMAFGKPVLCYLRKDLFQYNPIWEECPIVNTSPDDIESNVKKLYFDKNLRVELGKKGRKYVEKYHSLEYVGQRLDKIINRIWEKKWN